jgi:acetyl-CoA acetyltransferase
MQIKPKTAIVGIGQTEYSWASGRSETALAVEAILNALEDAGLSVADVDGLVHFAHEATAPSELVGLMKMRPLAFAAADGNGAAFAPGLLSLADLAIASGRARVVVAFRAFNGRSQSRMGRPSDATVKTADQTIKARGNSPIGGEFSGPYGLVSPAQVFALWANAYRERFNLSTERLRQALEAVVLTERRYATNNPVALLRDKPLSAEEYAASPILADPIRRADMCLENDGACAIVLASSEIAVDCPQRPVYLLGEAQAIIPGYNQLFLHEKILPPSPPPDFVPEVLTRLSLKPNDLDVLGLYDATSFNVISDVETIGLCGPGEGVDWVQEPTVPYNTGGGHLAEAYFQGVSQILEVVRQLQGRSANQIPQARLGLIGGANLNAVAVLSNEVLT